MELWSGSTGPAGQGQLGCRTEGVERIHHGRHPMSSCTVVAVTVAISSCQPRDALRKTEVRSCPLPISSHGSPLHTEKTPSPCSGLGGPALPAPLLPDLDSSRSPRTHVLWTRPPAKLFPETPAWAPHFAKLFLREAFPDQHLPNPLPFPFLGLILTSRGTYHRLVRHVLTRLFSVWQP